MTTIVVKIGGKAAESRDGLDSLCQEMLAL